MIIINPILIINVLSKVKYNSGCSNANDPFQFLGQWISPIG